MSREHAEAHQLICPLHHPTSSWVHSLWPYWQHRLIHSPGISWSQIPIRDTQFTRVPSESLAIKLKFVVWDEGMRNPKLSDNVLPHKPFGIYVPNVRQWLSFNPLGKVISANQKSSPVSYYFGEGPHNVQTPLSKRPTTRQRIKNAPWLMNVRSKSLTLITLLHVFLCFPLHIRSPISLSKGPMR